MLLGPSYNIKWIMKSKTPKYELERNINRSRIPYRNGKSDSNERGRRARDRRWRFKRREEMIEMRRGRLIWGAMSSDCRSSDIKECRSTNIYILAVTIAQEGDESDGV